MQKQSLSCFSWQTAYRRRSPEEATLKEVPATRSKSEQRNRMARRQGGSNTTTKISIASSVYLLLSSAIIASGQQDYLGGTSNLSSLNCDQVEPRLGPTPLARHSLRPGISSREDAAARISSSTDYSNRLDVGEAQRIWPGGPAKPARPRRAVKQVDSTRVVAVSGQRVELQCPLAGELQAHNSLVWRKDGVRLNQLNPRQRISANGTLSISAAQSKLDEATYECSLGRHDHEEAQEGPEEPEEARVHQFQLKLVVAPRLAPFEFPADAQVGMKVVLTCSALEGQQPISFVWLKDNQLIGADHSGAGAPVNSLAELHQQQLADKLALAGSNAFAGTERKRSEYVLVLEEPASRLAVKLPGSTTPASEPLPLPILSDSNIRVRQSDDYSILSIEKLELKHSGRYTCSAQNEAARSSHSSLLVINAPASFAVEPRDGDLVSGQSGQLDCAASGQPRPSVSWSRARESANNKLWDYVPVYDNLRYTTLPNGTLLISNVTQREQGYYLCSAKNGFGPEVSKLIKISVHEPARLSAKYRTVEVRIEERANMLCQATGEKPISIDWHDKEGNAIHSADKRFIIDNNPLETGEQANANSTVSRLILARSARADSGHYSCQASNKHGADKMVINLLVQDVPDKVTDLKVTNVTAGTISLRWQLAFSGNSPISSYLVQYQSDDPLDDLLMSSSESQSIGAQVPSIGARQSNSADKSLPSLPASALKAALDALNIESSLESADEAIDRTLVELTIQQSSTSLVVKELNPYCVYRLRLAGINKIGLGEFSDWIRAKTEEAPPSGAALKIAAAATGPNSIKLTWNPPDRRSWNGQLIGFNIGYRPIDSLFELNKTIEWAPPSLQSLFFDTRDALKSKQQQLLAAKDSAELLSNSSIVAGNDKEQQSNAAADSSHSKSSRYTLRQHLKQLLAMQQQELVAHLTNLQRSTSYLVWIQAINNRGASPQSHAINVRTLDDVPPSAPAIKIHSATPNSITIAWALPSNFVSAANYYSIFYRRVSQHQTVAPLDDQAKAQHSAQVKLDTAGQTVEPGAFVERTVSGHQLMVLSAASADPLALEANNLLAQQHQQHQQGVKAAFLHAAKQHYQQFMYTLDQLDCGSVYELYMTTRNSVGKSEPSSVVTTRTLGEPPLAPSSKSNLFAKIAVNEVTLNLAAWSTGGCPLTHLTLRYKQAPVPVAASVSTGGQSAPAPLNSTLTVSWPISVSLPMSVLEAINTNQPIKAYYLTGNSKRDKGEQQVSMHQQAEANPTYTLKNLLASTCYELEIAAHNAAGQTKVQYEFVTSNVNGTRSGFSRKEGVYRLDQRGFPIEDESSALTEHQLVLGNALLEQQQAANYANQSASGAQLIPLLIMLLCLICLIVSSTFCYYRIRDSLKATRRRSASPADSAIGGAQAAQSLNVNNNCKQQTNSIGKSAMWRLNNTLNRRQQHHSATLKSANHNQHNDHDDLESPNNAVHYFLRDSNQAAPSNSLLLKHQQPAGFSQSVSMKDFNLIDSHGNKQVSNGVNTSTLNYKTSANYNRVQVHRDCANKTTTLRNGRLATNMDSGQYDHCNNYTDQMCSLYNAPGLAKHPSGEQQDAVRLMLSSSQRGAPVANGGCNNVAYEPTNQVCNFAQDNFQRQQQQETSWTNYAENQYADKPIQPPGTIGTNYAIPTATNYLADQVNNMTYCNMTTANIDNYGQLPPRLSAEERINCTENSIDACIQQLMSQQYQQEQQQQYALIVNSKPEQQANSNRCLYGTSENFNAIQNNQVNNLANRQNDARSTNQSVIESTTTNQNSSSSSSGIDSGPAHPDCVSIATGTSHSNNSNDGYQFANANCNILAESHLNNDQFSNVKNSLNISNGFDLK